jgi:hypothetical protein
MVRESSRSKTALQVLALLALTVAGCSSRAPNAPAADTGPGHDVVAADAGPLQPWSFAPEDDGTASPAVALRLEQVTGDRATFTIIGRGVPRLQGLAFRLTYPPARVAVAAKEVGAGWYGTGADLVSRFATQAEGELWAGIGFSGSRSVDVTEERELARVELTLSGADPVSLAFRPSHNTVIDPDGARVTARWLGGQLRRGGK